MPRVGGGGSWPGVWRRGLVLAALAVLLGLFMLLHSFVPNGSMRLGSLVDTFLPWFGLGVPVLAVGALVRRSASAAVALLVPVLVWVNFFGGPLVGKSHSGGDLTLASHNVGAANRDPVGTARELAASGADVLALEELGSQATGVYERELAKAYPHHTVQGTAGLWSKLPLSDVRPIDIKMDYGPLAGAKQPRLDENRSLRATVATDKGPLVVFVAHLASVRVNPRAGFGTAQRDRGVEALGQAVAAERNERVVLLGDLNGSVGDRAFDDLTSRMRSAQDAAGDGFGFTWPASFPVVRIDQILVRGLEPRSSWVLPRTGSDHRPVAARVSW
ncbi:endonuclease/exonuclease/phosphatase family protein [Actinomadura terrae]|uniref:endonuclease/exonuclease/phosphatase family protein n=1 Tax=Actinomadura terrae TaxID=604353 RepID=UPI003555FC57